MAFWKCEFYLRQIVTDYSNHEGAGLNYFFPTHPVYLIRVFHHGFSTHFVINPTTATEVIDLLQIDVECIYSETKRRFNKWKVMSTYSDVEYQRLSVVNSEEQYRFILLKISL